MTPAPTPISILRGDSWATEWTEFTNEDGTLATSLSGWAFFLTIKLASDTADNDDAAPVKKSVGSGITIDGLKVLVDVTPTDTNSLTAGTFYRWDLQAKPPSGRIYTVARGPLTVERDTTRRTT